MPKPARHRSPGIVVAWMPISRRSETIAHLLGYELVLVDRYGFRRPWIAPLAYLWSIARTIRVLVRHRPRAAVIVAPPFVAAWVTWPFLALLRAPFAVDIHSGALLDRRWRWSVGLLAVVARRSVGALVTLPSLEAPLTRLGVTSLVVPDPLPDLPPADVPFIRPRGQPPTVVAICGWGADEPLQALADAARGRAWRLVLTGRPRFAVDPGPNVALVGHLPEADYVERLRTADAIVVLTTREQTLLSGAWEGLAVGRPLVLSGTEALRTTFRDAAIYVDDRPAGIAEGIEQALADPDAADRVARARTSIRFANEAALAALAERLGAHLTAGAGPGSASGGSPRPTPDHSSRAERSADQAR